MLRRLIQQVAVSTKCRSITATKSSLFSLAKITSSTTSYSTNRRAPQRKSTLPSPTRQEKLAKDNALAQKISQPPSITLKDLNSRNEIQQKMVDYLDHKITIGELLRAIGMSDQLLFPIHMVNGQETGAIMRTSEVFPEYVPSGNWPPGVNFEIRNWITVFLFTGENTLRLFEPVTKLKLTDMLIGHILQMLANEQQKSAVSHIIIDPASASLILQEEQIMYLPYYRQVAFSEANIESLWNFSQFSLNPNRVVNTEVNAAEEHMRNCTPKLSPFLILCKQNFDLSKPEPNQTGVFFLENDTVLPIWTAEDISNEYPEKHPELDMSEYKFFPIDGEDLWTQLGKNKKLTSQCVLQFNPDTPKTCLFHGRLAEEIHSTPIPSEWKERMQPNKQLDE
jgi:hypothetical protein